jgi:hypothetical protein
MVVVCPSRSWTILAGSSRPPSARRLMHQDAKKCRRLCIPPYFAATIGLPFLSIFGIASSSRTGTVIPALIWMGCRPRVTMLPRVSTFPLPLGKTKSSSRLPSSILRPGHFNFHSRRAFRTGSGIGTVRSPLSDLGAANLVAAIGSLPDVQHPRIKVDVLPSEAAKLGSS